VLRLGQLAARHPLFGAHTSALLILILNRGESEWISSVEVSFFLRLLQRRLLLFTPAFKQQYREKSQVYEAPVLSA
jgi:hypothetical protein